MKATDSNGLERRETTSVLVADDPVASPRDYYLHTMDLSELYAELTTSAAQPPAGATTVEAPKATVSGMVTYAAWGEPVDVEAPPKEQVGKIKTPQAAQPPKVASAKPTG